jgi:stage V sporulation protein R
MEELNLFQHDKRGKERVVTRVADEENWKDLRDTLIKNVGTGSIPVIKVEDADFGRNRTLYLKHYHDGRDLQLEYAERTLKHAAALWEREVALETSINGKGSLLKMIGESMKIERL